MPLSNCQTENEFVEKALLFYCDYVVSQDAFSALHTTVQGAEGHIYRLLFKLAVEVDIILPMMRNPKKRWTMNRIWNINSITGLAA